MQWIEVSVPTRSDEIDDVCAQLAELGAGGMVVEDEADFQEFLEHNHQYWDYVDDALEAQFRGVSRIKFYLSDDDDGRAQLETIRAMLPDAKKIGILYTTSEVNSLSTIETYKSLAPDYGFEIVESGISTAADIPLALDALLGKVDCLTNLTDNTVVSALALVLDKANAAGKPVFGSEIEQVKLGCVAAEGLDYVALGRQTGLMAAKVLKGEVKASDMAYEVISDPSLYVNAEALARFSITLSDDLAARAIEAE